MIIHLESITRSYGDTRALKGITLEVGAGQVLGYIGPNGAGKTTTVKILTAVLRPDSGSVRVCGFDAVKDSLEVKKRVGYVPEAAALYESMTPMEYGRFVGRLQWLDERVLGRRLERFLSIFGLHENRHDPMATFSKGMKQKIAALTALLHAPSTGIEASNDKAINRVRTCILVLPETTHSQRHTSTRAQDQIKVATI